MAEHAQVIPSRLDETRSLRKPFFQPGTTIVPNFNLIGGMAGANGHVAARVCALKADAPQLHMRPPPLPRVCRRHAVDRLHSARAGCA